MIINLEKEESNYYRVKFAGMPYEIYSYGLDTLDAIAQARADLIEAGEDTETTLPDLRSATVRPAVYKEWTYGTEHYRNDGTFIKDTRKPCVNCSTPVEFHTHKAELGYCLECSNKFWNGELDQWH